MADSAEVSAFRARIQPACASKNDYYEDLETDDPSAISLWNIIRNDNVYTKESAIPDSTIGILLIFGFGQSAEPL